MTTEIPPPAGRGKVPVWRTAIGSYGFVFGNLDRFVALGWPLMVITAAAQIVSALVMGEPSSWGPETLKSSPVFVAANILFSVVYYAMFLVFAVRWHRFFLLDERESVFSEILAPRNWRFLGYILLLVLAPFLPMLIVMIIGFGAAISGAGLPREGMMAGLSATFFGFAGFATFVLYFIFFRFSLVLPAAAVDQPIGLGEAWRRLRGNTWRYLGALILVVIPVIIVAVILMALFVPFLFAGMPGGGPGLSMPFLVVWSIVNIIIGFFATAVGITVLSTFYRHVIGMEAPEGSAAAGSA